MARSFLVVKRHNILDTVSVSRIELIEGETLSAEQHRCGWSLVLGHWFCSTNESPTLAHVAEQVHVQWRFAATSVRIGEADLHGVFRMGDDDVVVVWKETLNDVALVLVCDRAENIVAAHQALLLLPKFVEGAAQKLTKKRAALDWRRDHEAVELALHFLIPNGVIQFFAPQSVQQLFSEMRSLYTPVT